MDIIGAPQIAALIILAQRGLEDRHSSCNTLRLLADGGHETGREYYPVVVITHLAWIAAIFLLIPPQAEIIWPLAGLYLALQVVRYWIILTLGPYWTQRIITPRDAPLVTRGPFRFVRHPNYLVLMLETVLLPLVFGAGEVALLMSAVTAAVLYYKIGLEEQALAARVGGPQERSTQIRWLSKDGM